MSELEASLECGPYGRHRRPMHEKREEHRKQNEKVGPFPEDLTTRNTKSMAVRGVNVVAPAVMRAIDAGIILVSQLIK